MKNADYYSCTRTDVLEFVPAGVKRLLDVGCGAGTFGALVKQQRGAEAWGIELDPSAADRAGTRLDHVRVGSAEQELRGLPNAHFDCITFNDVLEHLIDPYGVLREAGRLLAPGGLIVASIPNIRFWAALTHIVKDKDFRYTERGTFDSTHLRFFTKRSMARMFDEQGYRVIRLDGINEQLPQKRLCRAAFKLLSRLAPGLLEDTRYVQYACVASPK